ncbi:caspase-2-like [Saccostrea cucullata]|uniref:caspase-2-like n=1 Tax=Saccostrea cuccullata TaxID=36930 RepID=UPI002ED4B6F5
MDKAKKEILLKNRVELVENINIEDGLLTELLSRKVLTPRNVKTIQSKSTTFAQTEELLDKISVKKNGFEVLSEGLIANGQEDIVDLYLKPPEKDAGPSKSEAKPEETEKSEAVQESSRPHSSPPRISAPGSLPSHPPTKEVRLVPLNPSRNIALCSSENSQGVQCSEGIQSIPSDRVFHPIDNPSVQPILPSLSHNTWPINYVIGNPTQPFDFSNAEFLDRRSQNKNIFKENEERFQPHHYINDPNYEPLPGCPRTVKTRIPLNNNLHPTHKEIIYVPSQKPPCLQREDTLDAMTKPSENHEGNCESPAKRQRKEDKIVIPYFESDSQSRNEMTVNRAVPQPVRLQGELDDPEIDLTDGPVTVRVDQATRQFYLSNCQNSYAMRRLPRGKALIINVNEVEGKPPRRGTDIDRDNLHNLLNQLHFDVKVYNDCDGLAAKEMAQKLEDFAADAAHYMADAAFVCLLSHGEEGYIFGTDGRKLQLDSVFKLFDNSNCPSLLGKPKIFVIQACRGGALDSGVPFNDEHDGSTPGFKKQLPTQSDMIICFPTQTGYYAWRNRERGSWYIEALVQIFMKYAKSEDICTMLHRVNLLVSRKVSRCPQLEMDSMSQMSEYKSTLRMPHLYFYPGIASV